VRPPASWVRCRPPWRDGCACGIPYFWRAALELPALALLAVTVTTALHTAHEVFVYASAHDRGTVLSVPALVVFALVLA
jgi:hypothetical protein